MSYQNCLSGELVADPFKALLRELNGEFYITSFLEDGFLYHTTRWNALKSILEDGFLSGNSHYLKGKGFDQKHEGMISFTTSKWRHLSDLPESVMFLGPTHTCYLKIPFGALAGLVKPVIYKIDMEEIRSFLENGQAYYLATLTQDLESFRPVYGDDLERYLYTTWYFENEWRMVADKFELPPETEVYVSSRYQLKAVRKLTDLPVFLDRELLLLLTELDRPKRAKRMLQRIIGRELYAKIPCVDIRRQEERTANGRVSREQAILFNVRFLDGITIIRRLRAAGFTVWTYGQPWKHRPYADLFVDLTVKRESGACLNGG